MFLFVFIIGMSVIIQSLRIIRNGPGEEYRKISNIRRTKSPNLNASLLAVQLSLPNPIKPGVKSRMKM